MKPPVEAIEAASVRAMPAPATTEVGGWLASAATGAMLRLNSVTAFGLLPRDPPAAVAAVERWYRERGLPPAFRLTDRDVRLDGLLDGLGYRAGHEVVVMTAPARACEAAVTPLRPEEFLAAHARFTGEPTRRTAELGAVIGRLALPHLLGSRRESGVTVAVGRLVADGDLSGLFDLAVEPAFRRGGYGAGLTRGLVGWAASQGSRWVYLQVSAGNSPALALYRSLGFEERYRYHSRVAPNTAD